jgi:hypothetical protein
MRNLLNYLAVGGVCLAGSFLRAQSTDAYEQPPISYSATRPNDAIARLQTRLTSGELKFSGSDKEIVEALLRELRIPAESQVVVFSKTSFQRDRIRPEHPRAIYFSDTCYVGWVPSGLVEVTDIDPVLGPIFYSFDPSASKPEFTRDADCLRCHGGTFHRGIPSIFARSVIPNEDGEPLLRFGTELVDFRTPFTNRWGGWYVTGQHGSALHRGNVMARGKDNEPTDFKRGANVKSLGGFFETKTYLAEGSDIVALLVFEHQTAMQNTLTRASMECRRMLAYQQNLQRELKETVTDELTYDSVKSVFESSARQLVDDLLFKGEAPLPDGIAGSEKFQGEFLASARRANDGSSLKEFQLRGHLFRNRCSYLIYSEGFLNLPEQLKRRVYERLGRALHPTNPDPQYTYIPSEERGRIAKILRETHPELKTTLAQQ